MKITDIRAREVLDSRGNPTVEVDVLTKSGYGRAAVPSGASTGMHEALELRDGGTRYHGEGVLRAIKNVNGEISKILLGENVENQKKIDEKMIDLDGTENKSRLGANALLAVSLAAARCAADSVGVPLFEYIREDSHVMPVPMFNIINGGAHAPNKLDFQEYMAVPVGATSFSEALQMGSETYHELEKLLGGKQSLGDEGGFSPQMEEVSEPLELMVKAVENLGYQKKIALALDCAPSYFYDEKKGKYILEGKEFSTGELIDFYEDLVKTYPLISIEDPLFEDDVSGYQDITRRLDIMLVGDDLFVTNPERLKEGIRLHMCNALLLKVNQIGTLSEALDSASIAFENAYNVVVSHRSGETEDTFISHLAVALGCGWIKAGAPARGERTAKYNELLRIEELLGEKAVYSRT